MMNQLVCSISSLDAHGTSQFNVLLLTEKPENFVGCTLVDRKTLEFCG